MRIKAILIGESSNLVAQAEQLYGFMQANFEPEDVKASTILLASNYLNLPLDQVPTDKVELVRVSDYQAETILKVLQALEAAEDTDLYLLPFGALEEDVVVRWAFRKNGSSLVQVQTIDRLKSGVVAKKSVYANHVRATFRMIRKPYCVSLARDGVATQSIPSRETANVVEHDLRELRADHQHISEWMPEESASDLENTRFLVVGGRGMGSAADCRKLEENANNIGADFGVTRPVAMSGWAPLHRLVGVSGALTRPEICIAAAASGAPAFYAGISHSNKIIAINKDNQAPITKAADVVIIDDYKTIIDALVKVILEAKNDETQAP